MTLSVYVTIGNSDDRLSQAEWASYRRDVDLLIRGAVEDAGGTIYGAWVSPSAEPFQNACWCFSPPDPVHAWYERDRDLLRDSLAHLAEVYRQFSIAWAEAEPDFLPGMVERQSH